MLWPELTRSITGSEPHVPLQGEVVGLPWAPSLPSQLYLLDVSLPGLLLGNILKEVPRQGVCEWSRRLGQGDDCLLRNSSAPLTRWSTQAELPRSSSLVLHPAGAHSRGPQGGQGLAGKTLPRQVQLHLS